MNEFALQLLLPLLAFAALGCLQANGDRNLIAKGETPQKLATSFRFTEGPAADQQGNVFFTDQPNDRIMKWSIDGTLTTFLHPSGRSNGMYFDPLGNLISCADDQNQLWSISPSGQHTILVSKFNQKLLNGPNDVWVRNDGAMYFTDPLYQRDYWTRGPMEQDGESVYFLSADRKVLKQVETELVKPNGIVGTADNTTLYVADIRGKKTYAYQINHDGQLTNKRLFCEMGSDGMTIDSEGNVYLTGDGVTIFDPQGNKIQHIPIAEDWTSNVCFGGEEHDTLFITASQCLYSVKMRVKSAK
ncbi:MAG: SMP-30/gluconolactonase/LRE family protein [Planctomycetaceae bacterium]|nr:SMP-30/gluconolactonase/LRE family protein [Planctomycetaceae bacterium]